MDDDIEEFQPYAMEVNAFERAGPSTYLAELLTGDLNKKVDKTTSPEDQFLIFTDATARRIMGDEKFGKMLTEKDIEIMLKKTKYIVGLRFKNPMAYILGYIASKGGTEIEEKRVNYVFDKLLPKYGEESGVEKADVIRYARFWKDNL
jgi:hypothetical protein